ncbi:hypothetical protein [uncultured Mucilaginibacter sp.]|uniref:hypothetical protein n=1 Tax=uncultured Mucilaginibacter sp. TaxID=797541 RepID=UPI0025F8A149|nr:hypothetical protein [uncultured Mucilaginibacter sp.]
MEFKAAITLDRFINENTYATIFALLLNVVGFLFVGAAFYFRTDTTMEFTFALIVIGSFTIVGIYQTSYKTARKINLIVQSIEIDTKITITTYQYKFLFVIFSSKKIPIDKSSFVVENGDIPMYIKKLKNNEVYVIKVDGIEFYVFHQHFDDNLILALASSVSQAPSGATVRLFPG